MNETQTPTGDEWQSCRPGEVGRLVQSLKSRRSAMAAQRRMVAAVVVLMTAMTGYYFIGVLPVAEPNYGGIVCSRVQELAPEWMANRLDAATAARIERHLEHCVDCRQAMNAMRARTVPPSATSLAFPHRGVTGCNHGPNSSGHAAPERLAALVR